MHFEVVSIKPSKGTRQSIIQVLPGGFEAIGFPLGLVIQLAYFPPPFFKHEAQLKGYPSWIFEDIYDIEAKVSPADAAEWQALNQDVFMYKPTPVLQSMLKAVFAERCLLRTHEVESKGTGYALTLANRWKSSIVPDSSTTHPSLGDIVPDGGFRSPSRKDGNEIQTFYQTSMSGFAEWLNVSANYPIVDRTGLKGKYQFSIRHTPRDQDSDPGQVVPFDLDEIGIKLVKEEVSTQTLYIDQIQRPSAN